MSLDLGDKRIGVALSDPSMRFASGLKVIPRTSRKSDFEQILALAEQHCVIRIIIGLPVMSVDREGSRASWTRDYAADLAQTTGIEVDLWDESLTTSQAEESLLHRGSRRKERRSRIDAVAAAFILQSYLDAARISASPNENDEA